MGLDVKNPVLEVSDKARLKPPQLQRLARKLKVHTFKKANDKGADLSSRMVCAYVVPKP